MIRAMLTHSAPSVDAVPALWVMEPKLDGWRWQIEITEQGVQSNAGRNGTAYSVPPVEQTMLDLPPGTILDGELLPREHGHQSTKVPTLLANGGHGLIFVAFDVLRVMGTDVMDRPWSERRALLERLGEHFDHDYAVVGKAMPVSQDTFDKWIAAGFEGAVVKDPMSPYRPGVRTRSWLKIKPQQTDDAVIIGFDPGKGKYAGQIGAVQLRMIDTGVTTTASGMTDDVRLQMSLYPGDYIGRRAEVAHHGLHPVSKVPRHPQYRRLREDLEDGPLTTTTEEPVKPKAPTISGVTENAGWKRNYGAMGTTKLRQVIAELEVGEGDAVNRVRDHGGSVPANLVAARNAARVKGMMV